MTKKFKKYISLLMLMIFIISIFYYWSQIDSHHLSSLTLFKPQKTNATLAKQNNLSLPVLLKNSDCEDSKKNYEYLDEINKNQNLNLRFENIHKSINHKTYRLRHFFKDGAEGEIETFLVYLEDKEEMPRIIEKKIYTKGILYKEIESTKGDIIYREVGFNIDDLENDSETLFLHYINNKLMGMQGTVQIKSGQKNIDCRFQQE